MTDEELRTAYKDWIKDYCNNEFLNDEGVEELPGGVELALNKLVNQHDRIGVTSESKGRISVDYAEGMPNEVLSMLKQYRKMKW